MIQVKVNSKVGIVYATLRINPNFFKHRQSKRVWNEAVASFLFNLQTTQNYPTVHVK